MNTLPPLPPGLLLDLDDTILTYDAISRPLWREACAAFADRCGVAADVLDQTLDATRGWYWSDPVRNREGRLRLDDVRAEVCLLGLQRLGIDDHALATEITGHFQERRDAAIGFFPGAVQALQEFRRRGLRLALVTNGMATHQRAKLARFDLAPVFDVICIEGKWASASPTRAPSSARWPASTSRRKRRGWSGTTSSGTSSARRAWASSACGTTTATGACPTTPRPYPTTPSTR